MVIGSGKSKGCRARITSQGQITVPKAVRDVLKARPGDVVEFDQTADGFLMRHRTRVSVLEFAGIAGSATANIPPTAEEFDQLIAAGMWEERRRPAGGGRQGRRER